MNAAPLQVVPPAAVEPVQPVAAESPAGLLTPARLRVWGARSALSLLDQAMTSLAGFSVSLLLARWMSAEVYGAFAVAFGGYLFVCGFHNVIVLEPLSVLGPSRHTARLAVYFREQIAVHAVLVGVLSAVVLISVLVVWQVAPQSPLIGALLGGGLALPFLLFLWLARRMCYVVQCPSTAILGSAFYLAFVLAGLFAMRYFGYLSPFAAFLLTGLGSLFAALFVLQKLGVKMSGPAGDSRIAWPATLRENWGYGRWLAGSAVLYGFSSQAQTFFLAALVGLGATGVLRAMQIPSLVMAQVVTATSLLALPALSYDFGRGETRRLKQKATLVSLGVVTAAACFAGFLALVAGPAEHFLFGGKYATHAWLMPILAFIPMVNAAFLTFSMTLRAVQKPHFDLLSNVVAAPLAIVSAFAFIHWWGIAGAAASMVLSAVVLGVATMAWCFRSGEWTVVGTRNLESGHEPIS
jgi:hypothetical protein